MQDLVIGELYKTSSNEIIKITLCTAYNRLLRYEYVVVVGDRKYDGHPAAKVFYSFYSGSNFHKALELATYYKKGIQCKEEFEDLLK